MALRMKNFNIYYGGSLKNLIFRGITKNQYIYEKLPKRGGGGGWIVSKFTVARSKRGGGVFEEVDGFTG